MRTLLTVLVAGVAALGAAAELAAPRLVEARVEERVRDNVAGVATVEADAGRFPFVPRLLADAEVRRLAVTLDEVAGHDVPLTTATFELRGIHVDRDELFDGAVEVTGIDSGVATVEIGDEALAAVGDVVPGDVEVDGRRLSLRPAGGAAEVVVPKQLLPCAPESETVDGRLALTCELHEVPDALVRAAG